MYISNLTYHKNISLNLSRISHFDSLKFTISKILNTYVKKINDFIKFYRI